MRDIERASWQAFPSMVALLAAATTCAPADPPNVETSDQSIINNAPAVSLRDRIDFGLVNFNADPNLTCSGVLYKNDWVITARHCVNFGQSGFNGATFPNENGTMQNQRANQVIYFPTDDVALVHLKAPFTWRGSTTSLSRPLATGSSVHNGTQLVCMGMGGSVLSGGIVTGNGTWRVAKQPIIATATRSLTLGPSTSGQIEAFGDSGGPCFFITDPSAIAPALTAQLAGIISDIGVECTDMTTPAACANSITRIVDCRGARISGLADEIGSLTVKGVQIVSATYGGGGCGSLDATASVRNACTGRQFCGYAISHTILGDPAPGCSKPFTVNYRCAGGAFRSINVAAEASGRTFQIDCSGISTLRATYGMNLLGGANFGIDRVGNVTSDVERLCRNQTNCPYTVDVARLGDPAFGKQKSFEVEYMCNGNFGIKGFDIPPEANLQQFTLTCP